MTTEAGPEWCCHEPGSVEERQQAPGAGRGRQGPPLVPSDGAWPCPHPDTGLLASRTGRGEMSVVRSHPGGGTLSQQPQNLAQILVVCMQAERRGLPELTPWARGPKEAELSLSGQAPLGCNPRHSGPCPVWASLLLPESSPKEAGLHFLGGGVNMQCQPAGPTKVTQICPKESNLCEWYTSSLICFPEV